MSIVAGPNWTLAIVVIQLGCCSAACADERNDWFKSLRMPGTKASCCDIGDCHRTDADWRQGQWWVIDKSEWRPVPKSSVLARPRSIDGSAYVCTGTPHWSVGDRKSPQSPIYCFVPPNWPS
jgi:hypothetical protein